MEECAVRELEEESGLVCSLSSLTPRGMLYFTMLSDGMVVGGGGGGGGGGGTVCGLLLVFLFSCERGEMGGEVRETEEMKGEWWDIDSIPLEVFFFFFFFFFPQFFLTSFLPPSPSPPSPPPSLPLPPPQKMWADDVYWLPHLLGPPKNDILGSFFYENKSILSSYSAHLLPSLSFFFFSLSVGEGGGGSFGVWCSFFVFFFFFFWFFFFFFFF